MMIAIMIMMIVIAMFANLWLWKKVKPIRARETSFNETFPGDTERRDFG
ncbi:MAG TPA: hypothetical protein PK264_11205 [Hyphomicrobiaceae bacterium]|nr:hypothetical protein [Hyphomicrobiaceae bacterium]